MSLAHRADELLFSLAQEQNNVYMSWAIGHDSGFFYCPVGQKIRIAHAKC